MYANFFNHLENFIRLATAFGFLFVFFPNRVFDTSGYDRWERFYANAMKMLVLVIVAGYFLVIFKLYEFIGLSLVLIVFFVMKNIILKDKYHLEDKKQSFFVYIFDLLEHRHKFFRESGQVAQEKGRIWLADIKQIFMEAGSRMFLWGAALMTLMISIYLRFYDAVVNAAPAMSDSYVTLAWIKYIIRRQLFHDGIYPQGFSIYLATLHKFSFMDPLYLVKYIGPMDEILIVVSIGFIVSRFWKNNWLGVLAALIYGAFTWASPIDWERQVATNSQEFAFAWVMPTLYFVYRYFKTGEKNDLITSFFGMTAIALVHVVSYSFMCAGVVLMALSHLLLARAKAIRPIGEIALAGVLSAVIGVTPIVLGVLMGKAFHGSSVEYFNRSQNMGNPTLWPLEQLAVGCLALGVVYILIQGIRRRLKTEELFLGLLCVGTFTSYYFLGEMTNRVMLQTRETEVWGMVLPVALVWPIYIFNEKVLGARGRNIPVALVTFALILSCFTVFPLKPLIPYKMERNATVEQYLKIEKSYRPTQWIQISQDEGYAVVLGSGHHLMVKDWLELFDPAMQKLINKKEGLEFKIDDIFIVREKVVYRTYFPNLQAMYDNREKENLLLDQWLKTYKSTHSNLNVYYEDANVVIYHIHQGLPMHAMYDNIWGKK